jgi:hypothetical protein
MGAVATVKGGLFEQYGTTLTQVQGTGPARRRVAQALSQKGQLALREIAETLDGVVAGSTASKTYSRVEANEEQGGVRVIETQSLVNRATTANDVTEINSDLLSLSSRTTFGSSPPANLDGNPLGTR